MPPGVPELAWGPSVNRITALQSIVRQNLRDRVTVTSDLSGPGAGIRKHMNDKNNPLEIRIDSVGQGGIIDLRELLHYRDLLFFLVLRGIKAGYAQSVGGYAWAIIQPAIQIIVFSVIFGAFIGLDTGGTPYPLLTTVAVIPWGYMQSSVLGSSNTLVNNAGILSKVYFPRVIFLLLPIMGNLVPFLISQILLVAVLLYYQVQITLTILMLPVFLILMILTPLATGFWLSSLTIRFRDVKIAMPSTLRLLIYLVPVMYPSSQIPDEWRVYYILNPFVGVVEGFRSCLLGPDYPIMWDSLLTGAAVTAVLLITGAFYFHRQERIIVDVI
jgi:lipopolysaccharide transport system permease protein